MQSSEGKRIVLWGIGQRLQKEIDNLPKNIEYIFVDKSVDVEVDEFLGYQLFPPKAIRSINYLFIVITSNKYFFEISSELIYQYGVELSRIISLDYYKLFYGKLHESKKLGYYQKHMLYNTMLKKGSTIFTARDYMNDNSSWHDYVDIKDDLSKKNNIVNIGGWLFEFKRVKKAKIYVITHKEYSEISVPGYCSMFAGATFDSEHCYKGDDTGDNISDKNRIINECTALYWIWKNSDDDYVGIAHYRRFLESPVNQGWPLQQDEILDILDCYDLIVSNVHTIGISVIEGMKHSMCREAFLESVAIIRDIFEKKDELEREAFNQVMNGEFFFICNMFITRKELFDEYCEWLFPILFEMMDKVHINEEWDAYSKRVIGFWAERMLTVWLVITGYTIREVPIHLTDDGRPFGK